MPATDSSSWSRELAMTRPSLLTMALPVTPISLLRFRKTSSIVPPHAPLVLFQQARVLTKKGGPSVSPFIVETMKCKSIVGKLRIRISGHGIACTSTPKAPASSQSSQRLACQQRHFLVQLPCKIPHARDSGVFRIAVLRKVNERRQKTNRRYYCGSRNNEVPARGRRAFWSPGPQMGPAHEALYLHAAQRHSHF